MDFSMTVKKISVQWQSEALIARGMTQILLPLTGKIIQNVSSIRTL